MINKELEEKIKDIFRKHSSVLEYRETNKIVICDRCKGTGFYYTEKCVDYHKNNWETQRFKCQPCKGDGRTIECRTTLNFREYDRTMVVPYVGNENLSHKSSYDIIKITIDNRNYRLERDYPELQKLTYTNYDDMVKELLIQEALEKDHDHKK